ncbi:hypothetical protein ACFYW9_40965 [Streptomyces sp. NPDC002698]
MPTDRTQQFVLALVVTALLCVIADSHPGALPVLTLAVGAFVAIAVVLKL